MDHARLFAFEDDFVATLRCIPMAVRFKLDLAGVKVSLRQWSRFTAQDRRELLARPCDEPAEVEAYRAGVSELVAARTGEAAKPLPPNETVAWNEDDRTPEPVTTFARSVAVDPPSDEAWRGLTPLERFVLLKLSRDNHDNVNFVPALEEFGLYPRVISRAAVSA